MKLFKTIIFIGIVGSLSWYGADVFEEIIGNHEFNTAYTEASSGILDAQLRLAMLYDQGKFVPQDKFAAVYWYSIAARNGSGVAKEILCNDFKTGCDQ